MGVFKIKADKFEWIGGAADDPQDRCLHGHVTAQFGDTVLEDCGTVSATALYLLKTLSEDKIMKPYDIQMIPCCGHFLIANKDLTEVEISSCDTGTDTGDMPLSSASIPRIRDVSSRRYTVSM